MATSYEFCVLFSSPGPAVTNIVVGVGEGFG